MQRTDAHVLVALAPVRLLCLPSASPASRSLPLLSCCRHSCRTPATPAVSKPVFKADDFTAAHLKKVRFSEIQIAIPRLAA